MAKTTPKAKADHTHFTRKGFAVGDELIVVPEVNGMPKGVKCKVTTVQFDGAVFFCDILTGPKAGTKEEPYNIRIKADDLTKA